jgi:hypothetical protein
MTINGFLMGHMRIVTLAMGLIIAGGSGVADAQPEGMPGMMHEGGMPMRHEGMDPGMMMCRMGEQVEGRLAFLKAELKIAEAQMPQWNTFADAFRSSGQKAAQHCTMMKEQRGSTMAGSPVERLTRMEQHMKMHLENLGAIKTALQPLYSALSAEQKKTADQIMKGMPFLWGRM